MRSGQKECLEVPERFQPKRRRVVEDVPSLSQQDQQDATDFANYSPPSQDTSYLPSSPSYSQSQEYDDNVFVSS